MTEVVELGRALLVLAGGIMLALLSSKVTERWPIPAPAIFLIAAAVISDIFPRLQTLLSTRDLVGLVTIALILILFDGGMSVGWKRFRTSLWPILTLGVPGTFLTAGVLAVAGHYLFDFSWTTAGIVGTALAPTDPAVMFSVFGRRQVVGRSGTILEGESGANDPVGIALLLSLLEVARVGHAGPGTVVVDFVVEMAVGVAIGLAAARLLTLALRHVSMPSEGLYPIRTLAAALLIYGAATLAHGSGFIAVFVAGIALGDERVPYKAGIEHFHSSLASLGEIVAFAVLGLSVSLRGLGATSIWLTGLLLALLLAVVVRPVVIGALLIPVRLSRGEKLFVAWGGLKGAVPILLGAFALMAGIADASTVYAVVFVVVAFSVLIQGASMFTLARRLGVPMREVAPEPWNISVRLTNEPRGVRRYFVGSGSLAAGIKLEDLPIGEDTWISMIIHQGQVVQPNGEYVIQPGDELLVLTEAERIPELQELFGAG